MGRSYAYEEREMNVKVITNEEFNGKKLFKIYEVKADGELAVQFDKNTGDKKTKKPLFNFGIAKARILLVNVAELEAYVKDQE